MIRPGDIVEMIYMDRMNNLTQRTVKVIKLKDDLILGYCYTRRKVRVFRKGNILSSMAIRTGA